MYDYDRYQPLVICYNNVTNSYSIKSRSTNTIFSIHGYTSTVYTKKFNFDRVPT